MVFKKPYAFFIKYFRLINLFLVILFCFLVYKLNLINNVVNDIFHSSITNFGSLNSEYIGFDMYLLVFIILIILGGIILLFKYKKKPLKDYLFAIFYIVILLIYLIFMSNIFYTLEKTVIEQTSLKLYSDISFLIILPNIYFIFKFFLIVIGFNLKKFDFAQDIIELKQDEKDNEEIELIFDKNTYKYKRFVNKKIRELKYYFLENKMFIYIISGVVALILFVALFSVNMFKSNRVSINKDFVAANITYKINKVYQTKYDLNHKIINDDNKFVIVYANVKNNTNESRRIDFKRIRLLYRDEYVYANNYYNKYFYDLGVPYNGETILSGESKDIIFIFKVPNKYNSKRYKMKFYDRVSLEDKEVVGSYKELKVKAKALDKDRGEKVLKINENIIFNKKYGTSNITLLNYDIRNNYIHYENDKAIVYKDKDINKSLLILDYKLEIDEDINLKDYFKNDLDFFNKFTTITYIYNDKEKIINNVNVIGSFDDKILLSTPYEIMNATKISVIFNFRDVKIEYKLK